MKNVDLLIIGGGSAGLAAAAAARKKGVESILVAERSPYLGGILRQCIHNGFGLHHFGEDLTGVEYARRCTNEVEALQIPCVTQTFVLDISRELVATAVNPDEGIFDIRAKAIVLAMGCRERSRGALLIPGWRSAGVLTAGTAQRYLNIEGYLPGKRIVILGSGDIGLIMARQFTVEGAKVERVVEIMPYSSGLARNIKQCLEDFDIPINYSSTVVDISGRRRVDGVTIAKVDENRKPIPGTEEKIECDTLLISAGLIPENELSYDAGIALSPATKGAEVDDTLQTSIPGIFACGNVLHVHDLVDNVSDEGTAAGENAAAYIRGTAAGQKREECIAVKDGSGVGGVVPQYICREGENENIRLMFRPRAVYKDCAICVRDGERELLRQKKPVVRPGEMQTVRLPRKLLDDAVKQLTLSIEQ